MNKCLIKLYLYLNIEKEKFLCQIENINIKYFTGGKLPVEIDPNLGFDAAVAVLGLKANVSEADHPLLCEGTRRQR